MDSSIHQQKLFFFGAQEGNPGFRVCWKFFLQQVEKVTVDSFTYTCAHIYIYMYSIQFNSIQFTFAFIHIHIYITFTLEFIALHHIFTIQESSFESLLGWLPWLPWPSSRSSLTGRSNIQNTEAKTRVPSSR